MEEDKMPKVPIVESEPKHREGHKEIDCPICNEPIEESDEYIGIPTSSFYQNIKNYFIAHKRCFLFWLYKEFEEIELTDETMEKATADLI